MGIPREELLAILPDYDALLVRSQVQVDAEAIAAGRRLTIIGRAGVGVDNVDLAGRHRRRHRGRQRADRQHHRRHRAHPGAAHGARTAHRGGRRVDAPRRVEARAQFTGHELRGQTLGIIGLGKIGMAVADRARGLEMDIIGYDPFVTEEAAALHGVRLTTVADILATADAVTVHVPLTPKTRGMIGAAELATMKPSALLVNVARGGVIDEADLAAALHAGTIAGAAIDVYSTEPPAADNPLLTAPRTILTPHLGASTEEAQTRVAVEACEQVIDVLAGRLGALCGERTAAHAGDRPGAGAVPAPRPDPRSVLRPVRAGPVRPDPGGGGRARLARHVRRSSPRPSAACWSGTPRTASPS